MATNESGIPHLRVRTDNSAEAREWNRMREAVLSLWSRHDPGPTASGGTRAPGFTPVALRAEGAAVDGVGLVPGLLIFQQSGIFHTAAGTDKEALEVSPTIGGTTIDSDPAPRTTLAAGDWEAWAIYREVGAPVDAPVARIDFNTLGTGAGTLQRDEKAVRLCTFKVAKRAADSTHHISQVVQLVFDQLICPYEVHQWKCLKTDDTKLVAMGGHVCSPLGLSSPIVGNNLTVANSAEITVTEAGSVWLDLEYYTGQQSTSNTGSGSHRLTMRKVTSITSAAILFRGATVNSPNPPVLGANATNVMSSGDIHFELFKVALEGGDVQCTHQLIDGTIWIPEIVDGLLDSAP